VIFSRGLPEMYSYNSDSYAGCGQIMGLPNFMYSRITTVIFVRPKNSYVSAKRDG
jgi:hypothetical protein